MNFEEKQLAFFMCGCISVPVLLPRHVWCVLKTIEINVSSIVSKGTVTHLTEEGVCVRVCVWVCMWVCLCVFLCVPKRFFHLYPSTAGWQVSAFCHIQYNVGPKRRIMFNKQTVVCAALPKTLQQYLLISVSLSLCLPLSTPLSLSLSRYLFLSIPLALSHALALSL